jgi:predicted DCC family thiol-disulfide oxidoreductase YuxK
MARTGGGGARLYLFYDSQCRLCRRFKTWIESRDRAGRIQALALADPVLPARFPDLDLDRARQQLTVRDREGNCYQGLAALRQLAGQLPGIRHLDWIYRLPGVGAAAAALYRAADRHRRQGCPSCGER